MNTLIDKLNFENSVKYHYNQFPPASLEYDKIVPKLMSATAALARYDQMLKDLHNDRILLTPLRQQEAVISSRMEGTVSTLDEILRIQADRQEGGDENQDFLQHRNEAVEVFLYAYALDQARTQIENGVTISDWLIRSTHRLLLGFGRGANKAPGEYKTEQNYIVDRDGRTVLFEPIIPGQLQSGIDNLLQFVASNEFDVLSRIAMSHIEFEALHPFKDGNGRIGRMLITLFLWQYGVISSPSFYISAFFEKNKDEYMQTMRDVSAKGDWTQWCIFFFEALEQQALGHIETAKQIRDLYEELKLVFIDLLSSKWHILALDFVFENPVFKNSTFVKESGIPEQTAKKLSKNLLEHGMLSIVEPAAGRRSATYAFEPLLNIVRV